jgi:hypothetical protein
VLSERAVGDPSVPLPPLSDFIISDLSKLLVYRVFIDIACKVAVYWARCACRRNALALCGTLPIVALVVFDCPYGRSVGVATTPTPQAVRGRP